MSHGALHVHYHFISSKLCKATLDDCKIRTSFYCCYSIPNVTHVRNLLGPLPLRTFNWHTHKVMNMHVWSWFKQNAAVFSSKCKKCGYTKCRINQTVIKSLVHVRHTIVVCTITSSIEEQCKQTLLSSIVTWEDTVHNLRVETAELTSVIRSPSMQAKYTW